MAVGTGGNRLNFDLKPFDTSAMANGFLSAYQNNMNQVSDFMKNAANMNIQAQTIPYAMAKLEDEYKRNQYNFRVGEEKWKLFEQQLEADQWVRANWEQLYDNNTGRFRRDAIDKIRAALPNNAAAIPLLMNYAKGMSTEEMMKANGTKGYFVADPYTDPNTVVATPPAAAAGDGNSGKGATGGSSGSGNNGKGELPTPWTDRVGNHNFNDGNGSAVDTSGESYSPTLTPFFNVPDFLSYTSEFEKMKNEYDKQQGIAKGAATNLKYANEGMKTLNPVAMYMFAKQVNAEQEKYLNAKAQADSLGYIINNPTLSMVPNGNYSKIPTTSNSTATIDANSFGNFGNNFIGINTPNFR
jgi:hypothetical protein